MHQYHMPSYADVCIFVKAIWNIKKKKKKKKKKKAAAATQQQKVNQNIKKLEAYWVGGCGGGRGRGGGIQFLDFNVPSGGTGPPQHIKLAKN